MILNGGIVGPANQPTNRVAGGIWNWREQYLNVLYTTFPRWFAGYDLTAIQNAQAIYSEISLSVNAQEATPRGMFFKPDGTKLFIVGTASDTVYQYTLSTAWNLTTATYDNVSFSVTAQEGAPSSLFFSSDGSLMYIIGTTDTVFQYTLPNAWSLVSASYSNKNSGSQSSRDGGMESMFLKSDGLTLYLVGSSNDRIYQYSLNTAWDVSTISFDKSFYLGGSYDPTGITFKSDGTICYINSTTVAYQYSLSTAWDIDTLSYTNNKLSLADNTGATAGWSQSYLRDENTLYVINAGPDRVYQYRLGTPYQLIENPGYAGSYNATAQETAGRGLYFRPDGNKMYIIGSASDTVHQYTLSVAFDITTAVYDSVSLLVSGQDGTPTSITFSDNGSVLYVLGDNNNSIYQYTLSSPWNLSTATYASKSLSVTSQTGGPQGITLKKDGTAIYVTGVGGVWQYTLTTPWDLSTASYSNKTFNVTANSRNSAEILCQGVFFSSDGSKMFVAGQTTNRIYQYDLTTSWDISTANYIQGINYYIGYITTSVSDLYIKPDGTKLFWISGVSSTTLIHQNFLSP